MQVEQKILKILSKGNIALKAYDITAKLIIDYKVNITKSEVKNIIHNKLSDQIRNDGFPFYRYSLINDKVPNYTTQIDKSQVFIENDRLNEYNDNYKKDIVENEKVDSLFDVYVLIDKYIPLFYDFRNNLNNDNTRNICIKQLNEIIDFVLNGEISLLDLSSYLSNDFLIHNQILGNKKINDFFLDKQEKKYITEKNKLQFLKLDFSDLVKSYEISNSELIKFERKPESIKKNIAKIIDVVIKTRNEIFNSVINNIIKSDLKLSYVEEIVSSSLFQKIENHDSIYNWVSSNLTTKPTNNSVLYPEKLKEFKVLCKKVWEDGVIDSKEQIEIDEKIISLGITNLDAKRIFNEIEQDFKLQQRLDKSDDGIFIKKVKDPKRPLEYFYKGASQEVLIDKDVSMDKLILAICELDLNNHNQKILKKINRIIENDL